MRKLIFLLMKIYLKPFLGKGLSKFLPTRFIRFVYKIFFSKIRPDVATVGNNKMLLNSLEAFRLALNDYDVREKFETDYFKNNIKPGMTVLDLGANIGFYTLLFAELVGKEGRVFAFEPEPNNFSALEKNVKLNKLTNTTLVRKAVSDKTGEIDLFISESMGRHTIYNTKNSRETIKIGSVSLDDFLRKYTKSIDFIKMDIEGSEYAALLGMSSILEKNKNVKIVTEFMPDALKTFGIKPEEYLNLLIKHGFKIYNINEKKKKTEPVSIEKIMKFCKRAKYANLLCVREVSRKRNS